MPAARMRDAATEAQPRPDIYTGLLGLSLLAMLIACVLVFLDWNEYPEKKPKAPTIQVPQPTAKEQTQPGQPGPQPGQ
jgi:hypothetical protein